jgi:DNA-binding transcriptional LysR family regulator
MLDVHRLEVLQAFAVHGTVAKAADALAYTPSAVSQQLAQLQREAGVALFTREGRRLVLTDEGEFLVRRAAHLIDELGRVEAELAARSEVVAGVVRVAAFQTAVAGVLMPAAARLAKTYPDLQLEFVEAEAEEAIPALQRGEVDVVIGEEYPNAPRPRTSGVTRCDLASDEMLVALPAGHPRLRRGALDLSTLADEGWVTAGPDTAYSAMTVGLCRSVGGFEPRIEHRINDLRLILDVVAGFGAVAIVPALGGPQDHPGVVTRKLKGGPYNRTIFAASRATDEARPSVATVLNSLAV